MSGKIIRAYDIKRVYGASFAKNTSNGMVEIKNSEGKKATVPPSAEVYHRGKKKFARYSRTRDAKVKAKSGHDPKHVGSGSYRQLGDKRRGETNGKRKSSKGSRKTSRKGGRKR